MPIDYKKEYVGRAKVALTSGYAYKEMSKEDFVAALADIREYIDSMIEAAIVTKGHDHAD